MPTLSMSPLQSRQVNPDNRYSARDLFMQIDRDYRLNGGGTNFGEAVMPVYVEAARHVPPDLELTVGQFRAVMDHVATVDFVEKALHQRDEAVQELVRVAQREAAVPPALPE